MIHRLLAVLVLVIFLGTCAYSQDAVEPSRLKEAPAAAETATPAQPEAQIPRAPANGNASPAASPSTKSSSPRIIIIVESTTEMERSEVIRKAVKGLKTMTTADKLRIMVKAKLMTSQEAEEAISGLDKGSNGSK